MNISANGGALSAQDKTKLYNAANETIANENRATADVSAKLDILKDSLEIRRTAQVDFSALDNLSLDDVLSRLTTDIFGNEEEALLAQGNINPQSVLSLLED